MLKGAIFDMDGVLIDSHPIHKKAWRRFLESVGKQVSDYELDFVLDGEKREDILRHFLGDLTREQVIIYGLQKEKFFQEEVLSVTPFEGVRNLLAGLQCAQIPMAVASSGSRGRVHSILDFLGLKRFFAVVITGDDVARGKPDPTIFRTAAERMAVPCADMLVIEDAVSGVKAAKAAGMKCLGIAKGHRVDLLLRAGADAVVSNFLDVNVGDLCRLISGRQLMGNTNFTRPSSLSAGADG